jgi:hypothetical protein
LRVVRAGLDTRGFIATLVGLRGQQYAADVFGVSDASAIAGVDAARASARRGAMRVTMTIPDGPGEWGEIEVRVRLAP